MSTTSILHRTRTECWFATQNYRHVCAECKYKGCLGTLECHHVLYGSANRKKADKYGLTIYIPHDVHMWIHYTEAGQEVSYELKKYAQLMFEHKHGEEMWMETFHKNYL